MLRVKSTSPVKSKLDKRLLEELENQRYKIECYKAWIRAIAPQDACQIIEEVDNRLKSK
jgi:hypothetical protein